ncbi:MAG TPA: alpha/beta fold hydrolase [Methylorubrum populi]|uniref:Alpha/beta fold hydrolase n=1 Tax=Methylorubrum populi TaxID=223967 RepID=A0A921E451_9HYPH|nr:alpha/beta fold hydrolase [Methylorubrum populi]
MRKAIMTEAEGVLLLHGIARRAASLRPLEARLTAAGYVTLNLDYPARTLELADIAASIAPELACFGRQVSRLHLVTHSMGGLVARVSLARSRPDNLGRVVMLGPPNGGSEVADALQHMLLYRRFFGPAGAELVTGRTPALSALFGPIDYPLGIIAGSRSLYPLASLLLPGPNDGRVRVTRTRLAGMADHVVLPAAHPTMMGNRQVLEQTLHFLRVGRFRPM